MLFPIKKLTEEYSAEEKKRIEEHGQICSENVYHMKQTVGNACGTVGILHAIANSRAPVTVGGETLSYVSITPKSYLENFFASTDQMSSDQIAGNIYSIVLTCLPFLIIHSTHVMTQHFESKS